MLPFSPTNRLFRAAALVLAAGPAALAAVIAMGTLFAPAVAHADSPGLDALQAHEVGHGDKKPVENRFFLKGKRFELAPVFGYVPNNPFARRYVGGAIVGYHLNETV